VIKNNKNYFETVETDKGVEQEVLERKEMIKVGEGTLNKKDKDKSQIEAEDKIVEERDNIMDVNKMGKENMIEDLEDKVEVFLPKRSK